MDTEAIFPTFWALPFSTVWSFSLFVVQNYRTNCCSRQC